MLWGYDQTVGARARARKTVWNVVVVVVVAISLISFARRHVTRKHTHTNTHQKCVVNTFLMAMGDHVPPSPRPMPMPML